MGTNRGATALYEIAFGPIPTSAGHEELKFSVTWDLGRSPQFLAHLADSKMAVPISRRVEFVDEGVHRLPPSEIAELTIY
jgi:hypothetical protein